MCKTNTSFRITKKRIGCGPSPMCGTESRDGPVWALTLHERVTQRTSSNVILLPMRRRVDLTVLLYCLRFGTTYLPQPPQPQSPCTALDPYCQMYPPGGKKLHDARYTTKTCFKRQALVRASVCSRMMAGGPAVPWFVEHRCFDH